VLRAACTSRLPRPPAAAGHQHHVVGRERGDLEDGHRRAAGADHGHRGVVGQAVGDLVQRVGVAHRELGVAAARRPEVGRHAPAQPALVGARAHRIDDAGHLAPRYGRKLGQRQRPLRAPGADHRVDDMQPGRGDGDPHLAGAGHGVVDLLVAQVLGRAEGVQADGAHGPFKLRAPLACRYGKFGLGPGTESRDRLRLRHAGYDEARSV